MKRKRPSYIRDDGSVDGRHLLASTIIGIPLTLLLVWAEFHAVRKTGLADSFVVRWLASSGKWAVVFYAFLCDLFISPLTVDLLWPFVTDWPFGEAALVIGLASALGGIGGYGIGRLLDRVPCVSRLAGRFKQAAWGSVIVHYGAWGVFLGALTPIPFTTVCWTAGILHVDFRRTVVACIIGRLLRMALYLALVQMAW